MNMPCDSQISSILQQFDAVSLNQLNELTLLKRMDSKYVLSIDKIVPLLQSIKWDYKVVEVNGIRSCGYKTLYFDYPDLTLYLNHQNGHRNRYKVRFREYLANNQSFFEIKQKTNKGKTLKFRRHSEIKTTLDESDYDYLEQFVNLRERKLSPSSENAFNRITLVSFVHNERVTIDFNFTFSAAEKSKELDYFAIIELKRQSKNRTSPLAKALKSMHVHPKGFSKYCMGMAMLNTNLKQNTFKKNVLHLKKIRKHDNISF